jgi:hypothetical protein
VIIENRITWNMNYNARIENRTERKPRDPYSAWNRKECKNVGRNEVEANWESRQSEEAGDE